MIYIGSIHVYAQLLKDVLFIYNMLLNVDLPFSKE